MCYISKDEDKQRGIITDIYQDKVVDNNTAYLVFEINKDDFDSSKPIRELFVIDIVDYDDDFASSIHIANKEIRDGGSNEFSALQIAVDEILIELNEICDEFSGNFYNDQKPVFMGVYSQTSIAEVRYGDHCYRLPLTPKPLTKAMLQHIQSAIS